MPAGAGAPGRRPTASPPSARPVGKSGSVGPRAGEAGHSCRHTGMESTRQLTHAPAAAANTRYRFGRRGRAALRFDGADRGRQDVGGRTRRGGDPCRTDARSTIFGGDGGGRHFGGGAGLRAQAAAGSPSRRPARRRCVPRGLLRRREALIVLRLPFCNSRRSCRTGAACPGPSSATATFGVLVAPPRGRARSAQCAVVSSTPRRPRGPAGGPRAPSRRPRAPSPRSWMTFVGGTQRGPVSLGRGSIHTVFALASTSTRCSARARQARRAISSAEILSGARTDQAGLGSVLTGCVAGFSSSSASRALRNSARAFASSAFAGVALGLLDLSGLHPARPAVDRLAEFNRARALPRRVLRAECVLHFLALHPPDGGSSLSLISRGRPACPAIQSCCLRPWWWRVGAAAAALFTAPSFVRCALNRFCIRNMARYFGIRVASTCATALTEGSFGTGQKGTSLRWHCAWQAGAKWPSLRRPKCCPRRRNAPWRCPTPLAPRNDALPSTTTKGERHRPDAAAARAARDAAAPGADACRRRRRPRSSASAVMIPCP